MHARTGALRKLTVPHTRCRVELRTYPRKQVFAAVDGRQRQANASCRVMMNDSFAPWFATITGQRPHAWQRRLGEAAACERSRHPHSHGLRKNRRHRVAVALPSRLSWRPLVAHTSRVLLADAHARRADGGRHQALARSRRHRGTCRASRAHGWRRRGAVALVPRAPRGPRRHPGHAAFSRLEPWLRLGPRRLAHRTRASSSRCALGQR